METPFGPLDSLVGRTFRKPGRLSVTIKGVTQTRVVTLDTIGPRYWPRKIFLEWIAGAVEVKE